MFTSASSVGMYIVSVTKDSFLTVFDMEKDQDVLDLDLGIKPQSKFLQEEN